MSDSANCKLQRNRDVVNERVAHEAHPRSQDVGSETTVVHQVNDVGAVNEDEIVGEQTAVDTDSLHITANESPVAIPNRSSTLNSTFDAVQAAFLTAG